MRRVCSNALKRGAVAIATMAGLFGHPVLLNAGVDPLAEAPANTVLQLVVLEAPGCDYCKLFRRDVLPAYQTSSRTKDIPVRFVDINDLETSGIEMDAPISIVPTFVLTSRNHEVGRIPGYVGPETFFHAINYLVSSAPSTVR